MPRRPIKHPKRRKLGGDLTADAIDWLVVEAKGKPASFARVILTPKAISYSATQINPKIKGGTDRVSFSGNAKRKSDLSVFGKSLAKRLSARGYVVSRRGEKVSIRRKDNKPITNNELAGLRLELPILPMQYPVKKPASP